MGAPPLGSPAGPVHSAPVPATTSEPDRAPVRPAWHQRARRRMHSATTRVPTIIWWIAALHLGVLLCQTVVFPNHRAPDERKQVDLIAMVATGKALPWPAHGTLDLSNGSRAGSFVKSDRIPGPLHLADHDIPARGERPSFTDAGGTESTDQQVNQLVQHPPLYYLAGAAILRAVPFWRDLPFDRIVLLLRWLNALLMAALPILLWACARELRLPDPLPVAAAIAPLAIPELTHLESSVNNDNLLILLATGLTLLVIRVLAGDASRRTALGIGALTTLALLTKGFALLFPAWIAAVYLVAGVRHGKLRPAGTGLLLAWAASLPGLAWWAHNKIVYGTVQPHGGSREMPDLTAVQGWSNGGRGWLQMLLERLNTTAFVNDQTGKRLHTPAWTVAAVAGVVVLTAILVTLCTAPIRRLDSALLLAPTATVAMLVAKGSWEEFAARGAFTAMQGRYLYTGLAGVTVVVVAAAARLPDRPRRWVPLALLGCAVLIQTVNLGYTLFLFWAPAGASPLGTLGSAVPTMLRWYPLPPVVPVALLAGVVIAGVGTVRALLRASTQSRSDSATAGSASRSRSTGVPA